MWSEAFSWVGIIILINNNNNNKLLKREVNKYGIPRVVFHLFITNGNVGIIFVRNSYFSC
jgi:hypothetical protein